MDWGLLTSCIHQHMIYTLLNTYQNLVCTCSIGGSLNSSSRPWSWKLLPCSNLTSTSEWPSSCTYWKKDTDTGGDGRGWGRGVVGSCGLPAWGPCLSSLNLQLNFLNLMSPHFFVAAIIMITFMDGFISIINKHKILYIEKVFTVKRTHHRADTHTILYTQKNIYLFNAFIKFITMNLYFRVTKDCSGSLMKMFMFN